MKQFTPGESEVTLKSKVIKWQVIDTNCDEKISNMPEYGGVYLVKEYTRYNALRGWFMTLVGVGSETLEVELPERLFEEVMDTETLYAQIDDYL